MSTDRKPPLSEGELRRKADNARRFLGVKTPEQQHDRIEAEMAAQIVQLQRDLVEMREHAAHVTAELDRERQRSAALLWSLATAHFVYGNVPVSIHEE